MSATKQVDAIPTVAVRRTFANIATPWELGFCNNELEVSARDPEEVMRQLPKDAVCFRFYDRLIAEVEVDGQTIILRGERVDFSEEQYFVDVDHTYHRSAVKGWWRQSGWHERIRKTMERSDTDYAVTWGKPYYCALGYRPGLDIVLVRDRDAAL